MPSNYKYLNGQVVYTRLESLLQHIIFTALADIPWGACQTIEHHVYLPRIFFCLANFKLHN